ncbi:MAG: D-Ala-D-Ala carboxypeptidase family metallohydrolase [Steroidobacteraceae bacterium]
MELSRFFSLAEMTKSETAIRENIPNQPTDTELAHLRALCVAVLDPLRQAVGPVRVNSGYRGPALNQRIGGTGKSQHMEGKAADIQTGAISVLELFQTVIRLELPFDQLIYEAKNRATRWVHVSHDPLRARGAILIAKFNAEGRASYQPITAAAALELTEPAMRGREAQPLIYIEMPDEPSEEAIVVSPALPRPTAAPQRRKSSTKHKTKPRKPRARTRRNSEPTPKPRKRTKGRASTTRSKKRRA